MMKYDEKVDIFSFGIVLCEVRLNEVFVVFYCIFRLIFNDLFIHQSSSPNRSSAAFKLIPIIYHEHPTSASIKKYFVRNFALNAQSYSTKSLSCAVI